MSGISEYKYSSVFCVNEEKKVPIQRVCVKFMLTEYREEERKTGGGLT